jgi:hypothetical protein
MGDAIAPQRSSNETTKTESYGGVQGEGGAGRAQGRHSGPSFNFGRGGRRDFLLRATKIVLTEPAAIRGSNSRWRSRLARNYDGCIFDLFNRIAEGDDRHCSGRSMFDVSGRHRLAGGSPLNGKVGRDFRIHTDYCVSHSQPSSNGKRSAQKSLSLGSASTHRTTGVIFGAAS